MAKENGKSQPKPDTIETVRFVPLGELKSAVKRILSVPIDQPSPGAKGMQGKQSPENRNEKTATEIQSP